MRYSLLTFSMLIICGLEVSHTQAQSLRYKSSAFSIYSDKVVQGQYIAQALSPTSLVSNYKSPANAFRSPIVDFKFTINGKDNEMPSGQDHHFYCDPTKGRMLTTPLITFGHQIEANIVSKEAKYLVPGTKLNIRLDLREMFAAFSKKGFYTLFNGDKLYKADFKSVHVAGSASPMIWDFNNVNKVPELELKDPEGDGIYETTLTLGLAEPNQQTASSWQLGKDLSAFPQYRSADVLADALYNLSMEEMMHAIEPDSTFRTGKEWAGVWTRDISYSIILSMAILQPKVAEYSLMRKVKDDRVIQDTGTGGAYPVSSDRMIWAVAAWEVYKVTGDRDWLQKAYRIIKRSVDDDYKNIYNNRTGLVKGESSFLDWREQTYPKWMQPADIYDSENLGTNAVHYEVNMVLAQMAELLGDSTEIKTYKEHASRIKLGIDKYLWNEQVGYYGQYLYGRTYKILSPRAEALGESLAVLFGIAGEKEQRLLKNTPVNAFGIPCIYPQIPGIPPYHNQAIWPFVQSFWALAAARGEQEQSVLQSMAAIYRPAALFLTNKENFVNGTGDYAGTQINSSNMLWSLSGNISLIYKLLFGIHYGTDQLEFKPFVPKVYWGSRSLENFKYRDAILDIKMRGYGSKIMSFTLDGKKMNNPTISCNLQGKHNIVIVLDNGSMKHDAGKLTSNYTSLAAPMVLLTGSTLSWDKQDDAVSYRVIRNGKFLKELSEAILEVPVDQYSEFQVISVDQHGVESFASQPVTAVSLHGREVIEAESVAHKSPESYSGYSGTGFVNISTTENTDLKFEFNAAENGEYAVDFSYANGNGPINTENKCAIRTLELNGSFAGTYVFPQRGKEEWSNWGYTNKLVLRLEKGKNELALKYLPHNVNMNGIINQAMLDHIRISKL